MPTRKDVDNDKKLAAVCGLFCTACTLYIGTTEDETHRLEAVSKIYNTAAEDWACHGCRSDKRSYFCKNKCKMVDCAKEKGIDFCVECHEYPCDDLREFKEQRPHRIELWEAQERIKEVGYAQWFSEMRAHYSCPACGTINSAYDLKCRKCGAEPSCAYVERHRDDILAYLSEKK
ncbi:MAG: DUF3795 domain-containing protein [Deltaproteobacteria bacterium]|nr:DUF3795 domain-containing protein [Deltaproteobacteria bacterium]